MFNPKHILLPDTFVVRILIVYVYVCIYIFTAIYMHGF